jgi:hypothetical protein
MPIHVILALAVDLSYLVGYVGWSCLYYRWLDPRLRRALSQQFGVRIRWVEHHGSLDRGPWSCPLPEHTWSWGVPARRGTRQDALVYLLYLLAVPLLAGLWPVAVLCLVGVLRHGLEPLIAYPLFVVTLPLYSRWWSGVYRPPSVERADG